MAIESFHFTFMGTWIPKPEISASECIQKMKNCSTLHGKQKSKPELYIMFHKKKTILCRFSSGNQPISSVRAHHITDFRVQNILFHIK